LHSITEPCNADYRIKGSKFLALLSPCDSSESAEKILGSVKEQHPTATHHCYAFRIDPHQPIEYSQDDGEPAGSAGNPILNSLRSADLLNVIAIIVRYYGGTKLGKSGLIDAYGTATNMAIDKANLKPIVSTTQFSITYPYDQQSVIDKLNHTFSLFEIEAEYTEHVKLIVECADRELEHFQKQLASIEHLLIGFEKEHRSFQIKEIR